MTKNESGWTWTYSLDLPDDLSEDVQYKFLVDESLWHTNSNATVPDGFYGENNVFTVQDLAELKQSVLLFPS